MLWINHVFLFLLCCTPFFAAGAQGTADVTTGVALQGANNFAFTVGNIRVIALSDGTVPQDTHKLLRGASTAEPWRRGARTNSKCIL